MSAHQCFYRPCQDASEPLAITARFPFSSALQRMSVVVVERHGRSAFAFIKGSPEMVASLCRAETGPRLFFSLSASVSVHLFSLCIAGFFCCCFALTKWARQDLSWIALPVVFPVPPQFATKLSSFSREGLRVLALAYKPLGASTDSKTMERWENNQCITVYSVFCVFCLFKKKTLSSNKLFYLKMQIKKMRFRVRKKRWE